MKKYHSHILSLTALSLLWTPLALADSYVWNPYLGRILIDGTATNVGIFGGDGLLPIYGTKNEFLFGDFAGTYATNNTFFISPGAGYRTVWNNQIFGAHFFSDYQGPGYHQRFWDVSIGSEWISPRWDAHANLYFPTTREKQAGDVVFANTTGDYSHMSFSGHNQYDNLVAPYAMIGDGIDLEAGYSIKTLRDYRARVFLGGYFYWPPIPATAITGVTAGIEVPCTKYIQVTVQNSYDNVTDDTVALTLNVIFGGKTTLFTDDVHDRLLDLIDRHIGIIGNGAGTYAQKKYLDIQPSSLEYNHIYFIEPDAPIKQAITSITEPDIGTFEHPAQLNQATLDAITTQNARIYLRSGNYSLNSKLTLHGEQSFYGRSSDYRTIATGDDRPEIDVTPSHDGFDIQDGNHIFSDLRIIGKTNSDNGISITTDNDTETLAIKDSMITGFGKDGLDIQNTGNSPLTINIENSLLNYNFQHGMEIHTSPEGSGNITVNVIQSQLNSNGNDGIYANNNSPAKGTLTINTDNSQFDHNENNGLEVVNLSPNQNIVISAINSDFSHNNLNNGIYAINGDAASANGSGELNIHVANSQFINNANSGLYGINNFDTGKFSINIDQSQLNSNRTHDGLYANNNSRNGEFSVVASNSKFDHNASNGIEAFNTGTKDNAFTLTLNQSEINNNIENGINATNGSSLNHTSQFIINTTSSSLNNNALSGMTIQNYGNMSMHDTSSQFNSNGSKSGITAQNNDHGLLNITATGSQFNTNGLDGIHIQNSSIQKNALTLTATNSHFDNNNYSGINVENTSAQLNSVTIADLSQSSFNNNGLYGIEGFASFENTTIINTTNATFSNNASTDHYDNNHNIIWN